MEKKRPKVKFKTRQVPVEVEGLTTDLRPIVIELGLALAITQTMLAALAQDIHTTNPGMHPIKIVTKERWAVELESIADKINTTLQNVPQLVQE